MEAPQQEKEKEKEAEPKKKQRLSHVFQHFVDASPSKEGKLMVRCNHCKRKMCYSDGPTTNLLNHLRSQHPETTSKKVSEELMDAICEFWVMNSLPFHLVEAAPFQKILSFCDDRLMPVTRYGLKKKIKEWHAFTLLSLQNELQQEDRVSQALSYDFWTAPNKDSYLAIILRYVSLSTFQPKTVVLSAAVFEEAEHTAKNIQKVLIQISRDWKLSFEDTFVVADGASNVSAAARRLSMEHIHCAAHKLHLIVTHSIPCIQSLYDKCKALVTFFNQSSKASLDLRDHLKKEKKKFRTLVQENTTRWNSTFEMFRRLLKVRDIFLQVLRKHGREDLLLESAEWELLEQVKMLLEPLATLTTDIQSPNSSISIILPALLSYYYNYLHSSSFPSQSILSNLVSRLQTHVSESISYYFETSAAMATALDPRFHQLKFWPAPIAIRVQQKILQCSLTSTSTSTPTIPSSKKTKKSLVDMLFRTDTQLTPTQPSSSQLQRELEAFLSGQVLSPSEDPYHWWLSHSQTYPLLSRVAAKFLAIPATSAQAERVFSLAGHILSPDRSTLSPKLVDMLIFLKYAHNK